MTKAVATAFALSILVVLVVAAFGLPVGPSLETIVKGAFGGEIGWSRTLVNMTPLLLMGLAMTVAWKAGMYNIGGEGQYIVGGLFGATLVHVGKALPSPALLVGGLLATAIGGALFAAFAAWLDVKRGVQVVISTILLNFVAIQLLAWAVNGPLRDPSGMAPQTVSVPEGAMLPRFSVRTDVHLGVVLALLVAVVIAIYMRSTVSGFQLRLAGSNPRAARAARMNLPAIRIKAMALSGALCGLAGGVQYLGISGVMDSGFNQQWGFLGIPVALLGGLDPIGVLGSSFFFGALMAGTQSLSRTVQGGDLLIFVIQGIAVLGFVVAQSRRSRKVVNDV